MDPDETMICLEKFPSRCGERQVKIVSQDDGHRYKHVASNDQKCRVRHYKIDGEVLPKGREPERCDFLLINDDTKAAYYIELKGSPAQLPKCIAQVESSERMCARSLKGYKARYRFILGQGHGTYPSSFVTWRAKKPKGSVIVQRGVLDEQI